MTANELRQKYLDFFKSKGHAIISSASLIPENDPTVLFTTAGMHPLVPYLMGEKHPAGVRLVDAQKCIRTDDIDEVGDATHHTFFEMMGNWSLGDYFKEDSIHYSWEFLTSPDWLGLDPNRLAVSVFVGDDDAPFDEESYNLWLSLGMPASRIAKLPKKNNWWGPAGITGPCGSDTEIFYWSGRLEDVPSSFNDDNDLWVEIWNNVFMQYNKQADGTFIPLSQKNVDTGLGLERVTAVLNDCDNYQTDLFINIVNKVEELSGKKYSEGGEVMRAIRIVADHIKAAVFIIGDEKGVSPSNTGQGYIVRRLLRRAIRYGRGLGINQELWTKEVARVVINDYEKTYPELTRNQVFIEENFDKEEEKFNRTLENGLKEFNKISGDIDGVTAFNLYQSYGFPVEITEELAKEKNKKVDTIGFKVELAKHQELSRTASAGKFKGGLADSSEATTRLHTAAHLLLAALRKVLGDHVTQKGSNITADRLRFDFAHTEKMTPEQISEVEKLVNEAIDAKMEVNCEEISLEEAKNTGAMGVFDSKYGEKVKVYTAGNFSREICGGPHVKNTGELGKFSIAKEESSSSGVRRIKAILS